MLEPRETEANWSLLTIAPEGVLAIALRATNEHDVVLLEMKGDGSEGVHYWFLHRAQVDALIGVLAGWRKLYGSGPGRHVGPGEGGGT